MKLLPQERMLHCQASLSVPAGATAAEDVRRTGRGRSWLLTAAVVAVVAVFFSLGIWQLQRLQWKHALIARVAQRVHAVPVPAPGPDRWKQVNAATDEYRHVRLDGHFLYKQSTLVQAVTELGSGSWLLTPLVRADGTVVLVNRGFVAIPAISARQRPVADNLPGVPAGTPAAVTGLLRMPEPNGAFLRYNDAAAGHWFSRDVQAIATAQGLHDVAPYFIDADAAADNPVGAPIGGLTVIAFSDNHLVYALTWFVMALMAAGALVWIVRDYRSNVRLVTLSTRH